MLKKLKLFKSRIYATALLLVLFLSAGIVVPPGRTGIAKAQGGDSSYTIQLSAVKNYVGLLSVAHNIQHLFIGEKNPEFQNVYDFESGYSLTQLKAYLDGGFIYLEQDPGISAAQVVVDDPGFSQNSQDIDKEWGLVKVGFNAAWEKTTGSNNNIVAVIDTGIDATHQDLKSVNYVPGFDFIHQQAIAPGTDSDDNGHGTLIAGVLAATPNNNIGIAGTNWQITLMPIKALDSTGQGDADTLAQAIVWATDHGAQFLNLSVGGVGFGHDTTLSNAITYAFNKNVLIVAAAGNDTQITGQSLDENPVFPVCDDNNYNMVLGVAATDQNDLKDDFSNYGHNCIDVDAPGKRILSTISFDPLTKQPAPNSYAYASGTSLAVPFVVGQAALIKALYPTATNIQIRDRIISTADSIDDLNLSQCDGGSCHGLLGAGEIDVPNSLATAISQPFSEGALVKATDLGVVYQIVGGQKRLVSPFVLNQLFSTVTPISALASQLAGYPEGPYVTPKDGTLVKFSANPTVYITQSGEKLPITGQVFAQRALSFSNVNVLSDAELNSWTTGNFLPPVEGTLVKAKNNPTVYWVVGQVLHPVNHAFFVSQGLSIFPIMTVPDTDILGYAMGEAYIR